MAQQLAPAVSGACVGCAPRRGKGMSFFYCNIAFDANFLRVSAKSFAVRLHIG
ncbi:hypothetical protein W822_21560 [Advenella kashmirensis W13003]|uniref:Uncharacterized protein n=1 Tax=Advenella kashmirensis W13003 TaxID=1424334 RepID=V8QNI9_9BURK|nr:hypothetical protein W822_21560 [Advenella kashmirensis W13003]